MDVGRIRWVSSVGVRAYSSSGGTSSASDVYRYSKMGVSTGTSNVELPICVVRVVSEVVNAFSYTLIIGHSALRISNGATYYVYDGSAFVGVDGHTLYVEEGRMHSDAWRLVYV